MLKIKFDIKAIALTEAQIKKYNPPTNPAKMKDPRAPEYVEKYGRNSWEVDALEPKILHSLLEENIKKLIDLDKYNDILVKEKNEIYQLESLKDYL